MKQAIELSLKSLHSDAHAFSSLYEAYVRRIYDFVFFRIGNKVEAEDITSDVFLKAFRARASFRGKTEEEFTSWLFSIAYRTVVDTYRKRGEDSVELSEVENTLGTDEKFGEHIDHKTTLEKVHEYLDTLPKQHRDILIMAVWDELPYDQIATIMHLSEANCRQIVSRTLRKIEANVTFLIALFFIYYR